MRISKKLKVLIIILSILSIPLLGSFIEKFTFPISERKYITDKELLRSSDIAGTDLYAESINAFIAGNNSVIKQSLFTNDTSILPHFDTRDPAFYKCNVLFSASNGITPDIFPRIFNENSYSKQYGMTFNRFSGFLYYNEKMNVEDVQLRAVRAFEIIKRKFGIDLIMINESNPYFFPFVGYYPNWELFFYEITNNLPMDGYWKALDIERLISEDYIETQHLSSTFLLVNSLDLLEFDITKSIDQVNFNFDSLDLDYLENFEVNNIFEQFTDILVEVPSLFGDISNFTDTNQTTQEDFEEFGDAFATLNLSNESHYVSLTVQYEGLSAGIQKTGENEFTFNLWDALGYQGAPLKPSEKIFISLIGAFMSEIDINIFCTEIIDQTPQYFTLYEFLLEQISQLLFYANVDFDVQSLKEYSFELFWVDESGFKRSYIKPLNLNEPTNFINFLHQLGFQGLPGIPTGIFNPIEDFVVTYRISNSEPNLLIVKELIGNNASHGVYKDFSFNITAINVGNETAWGVPTPIPIELDDVFTIIIGPIGVLLGLDEDFKDAIWEVVRVEYSGQYSSLDDFFNFDKNPRLFYFDTSGTGLVDSYYPNLNNLTNLLPYNENMKNVIDIISGPGGNPQLIAALASIGLTPNSLKDTFTNRDSVWNDDNWKLEPQESISYTLDNFSVEVFDTFSSFYKYNFSIKETFPPLPSIISGVSIANTTPQMALSTDNKSWIIESEEKFVDQHEIEIQFLFQNETEIDLINNTLDRVSILANFSDPGNFLSFEVFNYTSEEFQDISQYLTSSINDTSTYTFIKNQKEFNGLFDPSAMNNHRILLKIKGTSGSFFNISINDLDIELYYRDINEYKALGSRVIYTSSSGIVEYVRKSNIISLSTNEMSSLVAHAYLDSYSSNVGDINKYTLIYRNIGSTFAKNISITIPIPGIMFNPLNFTIEENYLKYTVSELAPGDEEKVEFTFYVPNSAILSKTVINYTNSEYIQNLNSSFLEINPNEVCFSAPVDYISRVPYVQTVELYYNSSNLAPAIGEELNLSIYVRNMSPEGIEIPNLSISSDDQYGDLARVDNETLILTNIGYNETRSVDITLSKRDWKGYYYPSINYIENSDNSMIQIASSNPIILGFVNFSILKTVDKNQIEIGDIIYVSITVRNIGNICAKNVTIKDASSFTNTYFELESGSLINTISELLPGEYITFSYRIQAITQAVVTLNSASIEHYYLLRSIDTSNRVDIKIIIPEIIQMFFVLGPSIVAAILLIYLIWKTRRYNLKKYELQRNESVLFKTSRSDAILKFEMTLRDRLKLISKTQEKENGGAIGE